MLRMKSFGTERSPGADTDRLLEFPGARQSIGPGPGALGASGTIGPPPHPAAARVQRVVVEALALDLAVLDLVDRDLAQAHGAPVAQC